MGLIGGRSGRGGGGGQGCTGPPPNNFIGGGGAWPPSNPMAFVYFYVILLLIIPRSVFVFSLYDTKYIALIVTSIFYLDICSYENRK